MKLDASLSAIVTGGCSGLGRAAATALREANIKVAIFDVNEAAGVACAREIGATFCKVNVLSDEDVDTGFAEARAANGQERIFVNCAGGARGGKTATRDRKTGEIKRHSIDDFAWTLQLNLVSTFRCMTGAAAGMMSLDPLEDGERGVIVNTGSVAAHDGQVGQAAYSASKAGIVGLTLTAARDLSTEGIRVNTILPGIFATPPMLGVPETVLASLAASIQFPKRLGKPAEFGSLVLELVRNSYFNGETIRLDGAIRMPPR